MNRRTIPWETVKQIIKDADERVEAMGQGRLSHYTRRVPDPGGGVFMIEWVEVGSVNPEQPKTTPEHNTNDPADPA